jgi:hypothetical protein
MTSNPIWPKMIMRAADAEGFARIAFLRKMGVIPAFAQMTDDHLVAIVNICKELTDQQIEWALQGVLEKDPSVRMCCLYMFALHKHQRREGASCHASE